MTENPGRTVSSMVKPMFILDALLGAFLGLVTVLCMFLPGYSSFSATGQSVLSAAMDDLFLPALCGIVAGAGVGVLSGSGAYVALEILDQKNLYASGLKQSLVAGYGATVGGVLPALIILCLGAGTAEGSMAPFVMSALALLVACLIGGFSTVAALNYFGSERRICTLLARV